MSAVHGQSAYVCASANELNERICSFLPLVFACCLVKDVFLAIDSEDAVLERALPVVEQKVSIEIHSIL